MKLQLVRDLLARTYLKLPAPVDPVSQVTIGMTTAALQRALQFAHTGDAAATGKLLDDGDFTTVVRMLDGKAASTGQCNNLGCAYALLASQEDVDSWLEAGKALQRSVAKATTKKDETGAARARANLTVVAQAAPVTIVDS